jgi:hypothetical protein
MRQGWPFAVGVSVLATVSCGTEGPVTPDSDKIVSNTASAVESGIGTSPIAALGWAIPKQLPRKVRAAAAVWDGSSPLCAWRGLGGFNSHQTESDL